MITGIEDKPTFLSLQVSTDRPVNQQVQSSILIVAAYIITLTAMFIIAVQLLLQRFVLGPLSTLDADIKIIGRSDDLSRRMPEKGDEEITSLTRSLNNMLEDIQEKRNELSAARNELALRNRDLEELNRKANLYLDIYLDVITYEILNAIMGLRGYAEYLESTAGEKEKRFLKKISERAQKSGDVIRNIETISRIYKMPPSVVVIDLADVLKKETALIPNIHIILRECNRKVLANDMLGVVFDNLFSNCLKFGGSGVTIEVSARDTDGGMVEISVSDNGPGIPDAMKPTVFDRFAQDSKTRSSYGLGLHIVKMLVEGYGGKIWADDRIPHDLASGAAIRFTLHRGD
jgi:signal transduction histidine kinase